MNSIRKTLDRAMRENKKQEAVAIVRDALEEGLDPIDFYEDILTPIMHAIDCDNDDFECIWLEHQMTSIARTLIEMSYLYVLKHGRKSLNRHVLVVCPREEYHELGAVMGANMLAYYGFKTTYVGANTPVETLISALEALDVDYLVLSVSNAFHLFEVHGAIRTVASRFPSLTIIGSGQGFIHHAEAFKGQVAYIFEDRESIEALIEEEGLS
ncbi:MAG: B12-binding domain-containing protein [Candidatus Izemoplasmataceae bacterium]